MDEHRADGSSDRHPVGRRDFLHRLAGAAVAVALPAQDAAAWQSAAPAARGDQEDWQRLRAEFLIPEDRIYLNVGTLGPQPRAVLDATFEHMRQVAMTYPPPPDWDGLKRRLGTLLNCDPAGLVFPRNTTEGMNFVANGLDLQAGDEVITTNHEHIGGVCCWELLAARRGVRLTRIDLPQPPADDAEIVAAFRRAIGPATRVISASHVTFTDGRILPVRQLVRLCREHRLVSVIDGAHPPGLMSVDLRASDPDFYASSPHKWLLAPQGTGFLYVGADWRERLWPTIASGGWDNRSLGAHRLNHLGTVDESRLAGLDAAIRFHDRIGSERVHARIGILRRRLADRLADVRRVRIRSPRSDAQVAGMVSFEVDGLDALELQRRLAREANVRTRVIGEYGLGWMRLSPHVYNTPEDVDRVVELIAEWS